MVSDTVRPGLKCCLWIAVVMISAMGCTSIAPMEPVAALSDMDFGQQVVVRICLYKDVNVSNKRADAIVAAIQKEFIQYGLMVQVPEVRQWKRPSFNHKGILRDIAKRPLEPRFDRNFALVSRDARDFFWGALLPEILGAVETRTHTKGYVVAEMGSLNQLLTFQSPTQAAVHEFYHMLGVNHEDAPRTIREKIAMLKRAAIENRFSGRDFFPGVSAQGTLYLTRRAVDRRFGLAPAPTMIGQAARKGAKGM